MPKRKPYRPYEKNLQIVAESKSVYGLKTYVSLFSSAGVGCYGFKEAGFYCLATVELLEKRLKIQEYNDKCVYQSGYIAGDLTKNETKDKVFIELENWKNWYNVTDLDVLIATPPCQGMSVANHKKKNELKRNSLVVSSVELTKKIKPKFFIFENVRAFQTSICTDTDGKDKTIREAILRNLSGLYNIHFQVLNFKDYGSPSSRTRTLVVGVRKDLKEITPLDIFPDLQPEKTLRQVIGHLPSLKKMGEISKDDIYHNFRRYMPHMESWISDIKEGQSAFDNNNTNKIPHTIKDGVIVYNAHKNGDKYTRQMWDKVAPCIHTRNDIIASQNTVHPTDNRVFSIREVMLMMSVPNNFRWTDISFEKLNALTEKEKFAFLKKEEMNIRQSLGEAVPTIIFRQLASKISKILTKKEYTEQEINNLIEKKNLIQHENLLQFISQSQTHSFATLSKIAELANAKREANSAFYTRQDLCFSIVEKLPEAKHFTTLNILEPSIGVGNFLPTLINKYKSVPNVIIDVVDIDPESIKLLKELVKKLDIPQNIQINYFEHDFLLFDFEKKYDIVVGNPPYKKITKQKEILNSYKKGIYNKDTNNIFAFFIEKAISISDTVSLIVPKSLINAPEFNLTRELMNKYNISHITDFGEKGFKGVKIETINFVLNTNKKPNITEIQSLITDEIEIHKQSYLTDKRFPYWLIYRSEVFDKVAEKLDFGIFKSYRDRSLTKANTKSIGKIRVLKSRNIGNNEIININGYDTYIDDINGYDVAKFLNQKNCYLVPNLTYNPRACALPENCITDGSVAILTPTNEKTDITKQDLEFYATDEFVNFYAIARNKGTRSLNIDNNSVFFFGLLKNKE